MSFDKIKKFIDKKKDSKNCLKKMQSDAQNSFYCVLKVRGISCIIVSFEVLDIFSSKKGISQELSKKNAILLRNSTLLCLESMRYIVYISL